MFSPPDATTLPPQNAQDTDRAARQQPAYRLPQAGRLHFADLDAQHEGILSELNACRDLLPGAEPAAALARFDGAISLIREHFSYEEGVMRSLNYGGLAGHADEHRESLTFLQQISRDCHARGAVRAEDVETCLAHRIDDVLRADLKFKTFLHENHILREPI